MKAKTNNKKTTTKSVRSWLRHIIRMAIVPHNKNDYRPHLIRRYGLVSIACVVIGMQIGYNSTLTGRVLGIKCEITINELLEQTNKTRVSYELGSLKLNDKLNQAAYLKAQDMFADQYWAHVAPDGTQPWKWFGDVGYNYSEAGENLAKNFSTTSAAMTAWMNSPGHKANVLNASYTEVGFAVVEGELDGKDTSLVVALYGSPAISTVAGVSTPFSQPEVMENTSILTKFAIATQSVTSVTIICLAILVFATFVAGLSHTYRKKLPLKLRRSWYRHHGLYKAAGLSVFCLAILFFYSSGQI